MQTTNEARLSSMQTARACMHATRGSQRRAAAMWSASAEAKLRWTRLARQHVARATGVRLMRGLRAAAEMRSGSCIDAARATALRLGGSLRAWLAAVAAHRILAAATEVVVDHTRLRWLSYGWHCWATVAAWRARAAASVRRVRHARLCAACERWRAAQEAGRLRLGESCSLRGRAGAHRGQQVRATLLVQLREAAAAAQTHRHASALALRVAEAAIGRSWRAWQGVALRGGARGRWRRRTLRTACAAWAAQGRLVAHLAMWRRQQAERAVQWRRARLLSRGMRRWVAAGRYGLASRRASSLRWARHQRSRAMGRWRLFATHEARTRLASVLLVARRSRLAQAAGLRWCLTSCERRASTRVLCRMAEALRRESAQRSAWATLRAHGADRGSEHGTRLFHNWLLLWRG